MWLRATDTEARKQKAARKRPVILMLAKDQAWPAGHRSGVHGLNRTESDKGRLRLINATEGDACRLRRPSRAKFGSDAVSAAGLAGAVGVQRVGGEDAHADQSEDTC